MLITLRAKRIIDRVVRSQVRDNTRSNANKASKLLGN